MVICALTLVLYNGVLVVRYIPQLQDADKRLYTSNSSSAQSIDRKSQGVDLLTEPWGLNGVLKDYVKDFSVARNNLCKQRRKNVAFLKVHKAGSTTVMNIFLRFAESYNLNVVYPKPENYLGFDTPINVEHILPPPKGQTYNILCNHVVYNKTVFYKFMPADTVFIAIVRDPVTQIISAAQFFDLFIDLRKKLGHLPGQQLMTTFLKNPDICTEAEQKFVKTRMSRDFGIPGDDITIKDKLIEHLKTFSQDFLLIMVMEMFDESLVLMKRYLCWDLKDIVYIPLNKLPKHRDERVSIQGKDLQNLKSYNWPDFILYKFFKEIFLKRIENETKDFYDEVQTFKLILQQIRIYCSNKDKTVDSVHINQTKWNDEFKFTREDCVFATKHEWTLLDELKAKYKRKHGIR